MVEAGNKTINWVTEQLNLDGTFSGIERHILAYYKAPMTFAEAGRVTEAKAIAQHLRNTFFEDGDFHAVKDDPTSGGLKNYRTAWIGRSLHQLGFLDLSNSAGAFLESEMVPKHHGILEDSEIHGYPREMDWGATCSAILAFLTMGRVDSAAACGDFLVKMIDDQPNKNKFYLKRDLKGEIIVDLMDRQLITHVIEFAKNQQIYWYLGMSMTAFAGLLLMTQEEKWSQAADKILKYIERCNDELFTAITNGKVAWGSGAMFSATGDEKYSKLSKQIWRWVMETQTENGLWIRRPEYNSINDQPLDITIDTSLERAFYMFQLAKAI